MMTLAKDNANIAQQLTQSDCYAPMIKHIYLLFFLIASYAVAEPIDEPCTFLEEGVATCEYDLGGHKITVWASGKFQYESKTLSIHLPSNFQIEQLVGSAIVGNTTFIVFAITDFDSGSSIIVSVSKDHKKINWQANFHAFNSSPPLVVDNEIYLGGMGLVAKLDAITGKTVWEYTDLYENTTEAFNGFDKPYISANNVIFPEQKTSVTKYEEIRTVTVNRATGKLVSK